MRGQMSVAVTGLGKKATTQSLAALLGRQQPVALISLGFAGGLTPDARSGDLLLCNKVTVADGARQETLVPEASLLETALEIIHRARLSCHHGSLTTVPAPLATSSAKVRAGEETGAMAADMEGYWMARGAQKAGIPWLLIRAILDPAGMPLPTMVQYIVADQGRHEVRHTVRYVLGGPWRLGAVLRLALGARVASKTLENAVQGLVVPLATRLQGAHKQ